MIRVFIGYDPRQAVDHAVLYNNITRLSSLPVTVTPIALTNLKNYKETHTDGSTEFAYSRFLTPYLAGYQGWAIYMDSDMLFLSDPAELWNLRDSRYALQVVKHEYEPKATTKFWASPNKGYKRKNWSSLILFNCEHPTMRQLTPSMIETNSGAYLHQFEWVSGNLIGELPLEWNWLVGEYPANTKARLLHYTLGSPYTNNSLDEAKPNPWLDEYKLLTKQHEPK